MMKTSAGEDNNNPLAFIDAAGRSDDGALSDSIDLLGGIESTAEMEVYDLNNRDSDAAEDEKEEDENNLSDDDMNADGDLLDMEGWSLRRRRFEAQNASEDGEGYNTEEVAAVSVQGNNNNNNSRRGLFSGWGRKNDKTDPEHSDYNNSYDYSRVARDGIDEAALVYGEGGITGDDDVNDEVIDKELEEEQKMDNELRPGDHIFIWQSYGINPRAYQRHAVVYSVTRKGQTQDLQELADEQLSFNLNDVYSDFEDDIEVTVVSFYHFQRLHAAHGAAQAAMAASGNSRGRRRGCKRELLHDFIGPECMQKKKPLHKVKYGRKVKKGLLSQKAGVGTALKKDQPGLILARVQYLLDNQGEVALRFIF